MNKKVLTNPLSGFMELLPSKQMLFNKKSDIIKQTYETFGFIPLDTPVLERLDTLMAKAGEEAEKQIYQLQRGNKKLGMRFDLTVPLARYVAENYGQLTFPFKRYAIGKVYRGERSQAGRFREFYQCDIDVIGDKTLDLRYDAELPAIIYTVFSKLGLKEFTIRINNRKIFNGLFKELRIEDNSADIMQAIDKLEKIGEKAVKIDLEKCGLESTVINRIFDFLNLAGTSDEIIDGLAQLGVNNNQFNEGLDELSEVISLVRKFGVPESSFKIDLTIARGLDYYTGTVYETQLNKYPEVGSICSGGRYDDLANFYTDHKLPGVGLSIGLTRLFDQLVKKGIFKTETTTPTKVLILPMIDDFKPGLELASILREKKIATEISFADSKMKKRLGYANKLSIPWAVFIGEDEITKGVYALKNLETGKQEEVNLEELISKIQQ